MQRASAEASQELARRLGIGPTDAAAMNHLFAAAEPLGPVELGHLLGIRSASATALVDRLEQSGHLRRQAHPADRRRVALVPSEESAQQTMAAMASLLDDLEAVSARLSATEAVVVVRFLTEAADAMFRYAHPDRDS